MPQSGPFGSVRGVCSNAHSYRDNEITTDAVVKLTRPDSIARVRYGGNGARTRLI